MDIRVSSVLNSRETHRNILTTHRACPSRCRCPRNYTSELILCALVLREMFRPRYRYVKCGVMMTDLLAEGTETLDLFDCRDTTKQSKLMAAMDHLKQTTGKQTLSRSRQLSGPDRLDSVCRGAVDRRVRQDQRNGGLMTPEQNMQLMQTLDDSWNAQDWKTFSKRHAKDCVVKWPNQPPTPGIAAHEQEGIEMFKTFPDNRVGNRPYKTLFAQGD